MEFLIAADAIGVAVVMALLIHCALERRVVRRFAISAITGCAVDDSLATALALCSAVAADVPLINDDRSFVRLPLVNALGATPGGVLRDGGCCSGKARLAIVAFHTLRMRASQATLYLGTGRAQHCLVEVVCREGPALIDPMYGLYYVDHMGRPLGIAALRAGAIPQLRSVPGCARKAYPSGSYYAFDFGLTKTANWTKSAPRRIMYGLMSIVASNHVDEMRQPPFFEWPQLMIAVVLGPAILFAQATLDMVGAYPADPQIGILAWMFLPGLAACSVLAASPLVTRTGGMRIPSVRPFGRAGRREVVPISVSTR